jgi:hypothetical protein
MRDETKSPFTREWIQTTGIPIVASYGGNLTLRALHYRLVAAGMTNDTQHYKKVITAMTEARWQGLVDFDSFVDHERGTLGVTTYLETDLDTKVIEAKDQIQIWATSYNKNRWENQPIYPEVFIEKKALQGVFERTCMQWDVALNPCKGYPSLTFQYAAMQRFKAAVRAGKKPVILYFGDYDCSGEDIPRSLAETVGKMGVHIDVRRIALMEHQVIAWNLPPAPTKVTDSRGAKWDGLGQVELDAVLPEDIIRLLKDALLDVFDTELHTELLETEEAEKTEFKEILKRDFDSLLD